MDGSTRVKPSLLGGLFGLNKTHQKNKLGSKENKDLSMRSAAEATFNDRPVLDSRGNNMSVKVGGEKCTIVVDQNKAENVRRAIQQNAVLQKEIDARDARTQKTFDKWVNTLNYLKQNFSHHDPEISNLMLTGIDELLKKISEFKNSYYSSNYNEASFQRQGNEIEEEFKELKLTLVDLGYKI